MHNFQHLEDLFRQAQGESSLSRLAPGDALTDAVHDYFRHYGLEALLNDTSEVHAGFVDTGRFALWCQVWSPPEPTGTAFVIHGYFDHLGLYRHLLSCLLAKGWRVVLWDLPGHGLSSGPRAEIEDFDDYQHCLAHLQETLQTLGMAPEPWLGVGQSTGAAILATDALTRRDTAGWAGIVLLAPLVRPWRWSQASWLHLIASPFVKELPRKYRPNSTDEAFTAFLRDQDPLQPERLSVAWITAMRRWMPRLLALEPNPLPTLILQGEQDLTVDWEWNLAILAEKFPNAEIHRHPEARHHLVNEAEPIRQVLFEALDRFIENVH
ncbi:alpha/beta hydrolase [Idiomarina sp. WRN-38]|jgi:alpha-beta hydrolase superfamily lysophospholipase|uniref:alpha/beta hydrolase n=1 Tax=Vreelandella aquamarina TaxID=77097 RepID=UPI0007336C19|nr:MULTISPECIES: alpha/beta hydrolase [Halomonas]KTG26182.1 alpha/beta hydrolase [Idiomarina sp. H105]MCC4292152.1 alpha/beta hydrolase [Halomonas axialensis]OAE96987.1 alpha/beta hydrolase [Idiomarina sp. WRN-38]PHR03640.1 MAG: alpha/beta hydrolase [Halomonas sp.]|tara:strand:- start:714 stop:1682 length:969 start_codon:yes stop_codon:yes gene_type:complete